MAINTRVRQLLLPLYKIYFDIKWRSYVKNNREVKLIVGGGNIPFKGWFGTDILILDVTNEKQFQRFFTRHKIEKVLAEHVLEHLTTAQIEKMLDHIYAYSTPTVNIRIAVPDGFHGDPAYIEMVKPGGNGAGADDHKQLFTYQSLAAIFERKKFKAHVLDYWDENRDFHARYRNDDKGYIRRSFINDSRNADGKLVYTSLIMDFTKS